MSKFLLCIIIILMATSVIFARDVTDLNWPSSDKSNEEASKINDKEHDMDRNFPSSTASELYNSGGVTLMYGAQNVELSDRIVLEFYGDITEDDIRLLESLGCVLEAYVFNMAQVSVSKNKISALKELDCVKSVRYPSEAQDNGAIRFAAGKIDDFTMINLKEAHNKGYLGQGVKIAILDTAFEPDNDIFKNNVFYTLSLRSRDGNIRNGNINHGNAVTEIVTRIAPRSKIILVNFETDVEYVKAIKELINQSETLRPNIIITSVNLILPDDYYNGAGIRAGLAKIAKEKGITIVSSAGNNAQRHYIGKFSDSNSNMLHNFSSKDDTLEVGFKKGDIIKLLLVWKDDWKNPREDLQLGIFNDDLEPVKVSARQDKSPPYLFLQTKAAYSGSYHIAIRKGKKAYEGLPFMVYIYSSSASNMEYVHPETSLDPGLPPALDSITVGSVESLFPYQTEPWSSRGKTTDDRIKPDLVALGGIYCKSCNGIFEGTSSAAPQVAGAAAIILSKNKNLSPENIKKVLKKTAIDLGPPGEDPVFGSGLLNIYQAILSL